MAKKVKLGEKVPDFSLESTAGEAFSLKALKGRKVVLFFYPKDSTPGCTLEGHEFSQRLKQFQKKGAAVFGISRDSMKSHENFRSKQCYSVHLLSDVEEEACRIFDVIREKNMYGRKVMGVERSTFLIDEKGVLAREWRKVKAEGHAQEVLEAL